MASIVPVGGMSDSATRARGADHLGYGPAAVELPPDLEPLDVRHLGRERAICCWRVGDVLVDPGPASCAETLLALLGGRRPRAILLTHVHLDHAGAAGTLARRWPEAVVYVHERGSPHVIDPSRLWASAQRIYGGEMERLWGEMLPVPEDRVRILRGGETLDLAGGIDVAYTPGHAFHHVAYRHTPTGWAFCGDVAGVRIPPSPHVIAPTPPPDIDLEAWHASLDRIAAWEPAALGITHFGAVRDVAAQLAGVRASLDANAALARDLDAEAFAARVWAETAAASDERTAAVFEQASPATSLYAGLRRYWDKRAERAA